jgi:hypothetical protein
MNDFPPISPRLSGRSIPETNKASRSHSCRLLVPLKLEGPQSTVSLPDTVQSFLREEKMALNSSFAECGRHRGHWDS